MKTRALVPVGMISLGLLSFAPGTLALPVLPNINTNNVITITNPPFNAAGDGVTDNTLAISNAIVQASKGGNTNNLLGGTVRIPAPGVFLCGPLTLKNNVNVQIDAGAALQMLPLNLFTNYPAQNQAFGNLFYASGLTNLEFSGSGTIDGQGADWWASSGSVFSGRPYMLFFNGNCGRVLIQNLTLQNPPKMHIVFKGTDNNITVQGITINTTATNAANTDGIDLVGANCLVQNCVINAGDDNIALGSSSVSAVSTDTLITNCAFGKGHGVSIGSSTAGGVSNLTVINCTFNGTDYGIRMKSNDATSGGSGQGGVAQNLNYFNIGMTNIVNGAIVIYSYYGSGGQFGTPTGVSPYFASTQAVDITSVPIWRNITISNVTATVASNGVTGIIWARMEVPATNLVFNRVNISGPKPFDVYSARGVQFIDCRITPSAGSNTFLIYNAEVTISNSTPSSSLITFDGLSTNGYGSSLALYHAQASLANTNVFAAGPISLGGSTLVVSNNLNLGASSVVNFILGTSASTLSVRSNLALSGTVNLSAGAGFTPTAYTVFTCDKNLTWGPPALLGTPGGFSYRFDTNTLGQVQIVPAILTVSNINDSGPGSLRQQIANAQSGYTVVFSNGVAGTITLTNGELVVSNNVSILGPGAKMLAISGNNSNRVFNITTGTVLLANLMVTHGHATIGGGAGIRNAATLAISNCVIIGNSELSGPAGTGGGGILNAGVLSIWNSAIVSNQDSGGFYAAFGGGLENLGTADLQNSTVADNALIGGTFNSGAGIENSGWLTLSNCTIAGNSSSGPAGGIYCLSTTNVIVFNSIIANNTATTNVDVKGPFISAGYNLIGNTNGSTGFGASGDQPNANPALGPLADNGGPTPTMALLPGSPAIDKGKSVALTTDQRGAPRPYDFVSIPNAASGDASDIGAFESGSPPLNFQPFSGNIILSWPSWYGDFALETTTNLTANNWTTLTDTPMVSGDRFTVTNNAADAARFYRLKAK